MDIYVAEGGGRGAEIEKGEENERQSERERVEKIEKECLLKNPVDISKYFKPQP